MSVESSQSPYEESPRPNRRASDRVDPDAWLRGGGEMAVLTKNKDWSATSLGPIQTWPLALRTIVHILLNSRHPMFLWWGPELIQFYNDAYLPSFGKGKHPRALGQPGRDCWGEIWPIIGPQIDDVMQRGIPSWHENQLVPIFRNGRIEDVYWTYGYSPVFGDDGRIAGTLVICHETTREVLSRQEIERARQEAELSRTRLSTLFQSAPAFVCLLRGPDHVFELVNPPYQRLLGKERDLVGKTVREAVPEVVDQGFIQLLDGVYRDGKPFIGRETLIRLDRQGNGVLEEAFLTFSYQPRFDAEARVMGIDVFGVDVTEEVRARRQAQKAGEASRVMAEAIPQQVWTATPAGALDFVSERVVEYFATTRQQVLGSGWQAFIHPSDLPASLARWEYCLQTGEDYEVEFRLRRSDGSYHWHLGRALALRDDDGKIVRWFGTNTDIDDARRNREELKKRTEFEQQLVGIVSHDLRNPLAAMLMGASSILRRDETDERTAKALSRIMASGERASRMIRDLLDFTQARLGEGIRIQRQTLNIHELADQVVEEAQLANPEREIVLEHEGDGRGEWDGDRLAQVVTNLLANAIHYSPVSTPVRVKIWGQDSEVALEVHNGGEPISASALPALFQPLQRGKGAVDKSTRSIGLGLFIVDHLVRAHGGNVQVRSDREQGTRFTVRLPRGA